MPNAHFAVLLFAARRRRRRRRVLSRLILVKSFLMVKVTGKSHETNMFKLLYKDIKYFVYLNNVYTHTEWSVSHFYLWLIVDTTSVRCVR